MKLAGAAVIIVVLVGAVAFVGWTVFRPSGQECPVGQVWDASLRMCVPSGPPPGTFSADWSCNWDDISLSAEGDAHDASTEFPDVPFVAADGGSPDLDATIAASLVYQPSAKRVVWNIDVDDDVDSVIGTGSNNNTWLDEDAFALDINCRLGGVPRDENGQILAVPIWGRIKVDRTMGTAHNGTPARVFYCNEQRGGSHLGLGKVADAGLAAASHTNDHLYASYVSAPVCPTAETPWLVGNWVPLGFTSETDPSNNGVYVDVWGVLDTGLSDYQSPQIDEGVTVSVELGTNPEQTVWRGDVESLSLFVNVDTRT